MIYLLLSIGGKHKQRADEHFAVELAFPVHCVTPKDIIKIARMLKKFKSIEILYQDLVELRRAVPLLARAFHTEQT